MAKLLHYGKSTLILVTCLVLCGGCSGSGSPSTSGATLHGADPAAVIAQPVSAPGLSGLPVDQAQPWESVDSHGNVIAARSTAAVNGGTEFVAGADWYTGGGDISDVDCAARMASGAVGAKDLCHAVYRLVMGGTAPGVVTVDANLNRRADGTSSAYWVGFSDYGAGCWRWYGPVADAQVRIQPEAGTDYLSDLGNLFIAVVVHDGACLDIVGAGAHPVDPADETPPMRPMGLQATGVTGGIELTWLAVPVADIAGYNVYYSDAPFVETNAAGVRQAPFLEGGVHCFLEAQDETFMRITAVDTSGNESTPSEIATAVPLAGEPPSVVVSISAPGVQRGGIIGVTADTAMPGVQYDFDLDGDGVFDLLGDAGGSANLDTGDAGVIRVLVRAHGGGGTMVALGGVSAIISSNIRPVADGYASPAYGETPHAVTFTGRGFDDDGTIDQYAWDFNGDGTYDWTSVTTPNPPVQTYTVAGLYNTKFRVTDDQGSIDVDTVTINVYDPASPPVNIPPSADLSASRIKLFIGNYGPNTIYFDAGGSVDPEGETIIYEFDFYGTGDYVSNGIDATDSADYDTAGVYLAKVRVTDPTGAFDTDSVVISVYEFDSNIVYRTANVGQYSSLCVVDGNPAIAFYDDTSGDLYYMRATDSSGIAWGSPVMVAGGGSDAGQYCRLTMISGWPAVTFFDDTANDLMFCRASNVTGSSWSTAFTVHAGLTTDVHNSVYEVSNRPAVCLYYAAGGSLLYTRAATSSGTGWSAPVAVDGSGGMYNDLRNINGRPAICYNGGGDLRFAHANDSTGTTWGLPVTVDSDGVTGLYTSMEIVDGNPAISYQKDLSEDLMYVRATDSSASAWGTPVEVVASSGSGFYSSLAVINGLPSIAYYEDPSDLVFVMALDEAGAAWDDPTYVDYTSTGMYSSLVRLSNGLPGIACYQSYSDDVVFARVSLE